MTLRVEPSIDGSAPDEDDATPTYTQAIPTTGLAFLAYDLAAQVHGVTVKARVQTRRTDSGPATVWSNGSTAQIQTATADANGPAAPGSGAAWYGSLPAEEV